MAISLWERYANAYSQDLRKRALYLISTGRAISQVSRLLNRPLAKVFLCYNKVLFFSKIILIKWQQFLDFSA